MDTVKQKSIPQLPNLSDYRYENIFNVYQYSGDTSTGVISGAYYYNINRAVTIPTTIDKNTYYTTTSNGRSPWTAISYTAYGTIELWWLIAALNQVQNPLTPPTGSIKILKPEYVRSVISEIQQNL